MKIQRLNNLFDNMKFFMTSKYIYILIMSDKTIKVKLNEGHRNDIMRGINSIEGQYEPIYNEAKELRTRFKKNMVILMNLRIFAQRYGTNVMIKRMDKLYQKMDKVDNELYSIVNKFEIAQTRHNGLNKLFNDYVKFCNK
jgi:hypothetical protein